MNSIYLMKDEKRNFALFKVGFTTNLDQRIYQYTTHNPLIECISYVNTQERSRRSVETTYHKEILKKGYAFIRATMDDKETEFFKVYYDDPFYKELCSKGLKAFECGRSRKDLGCFVLVE